MMIRIRMRGVNIGQVDDVLIEEYRKIAPFNKLVNAADKIISENILHHDITSSDDLLLAEKYVLNLHYRNLGEYITDYMRNSCMENFQICMNCRNKCKDMKNDYQAACDRFANLPHMPEM